MAVLTRAAYLDRVRRAFLLRVHPDRFCNHSSPDLLRQQAQLVQALSDRMNQSDFQQWTAAANTAATSASSSRKTRPMQTILQSPTANNSNNNNNKAEQESSSSFAFALEQKDGSLFRTQLHMNRSVEEILNDIIQALKTCGAAATLPSPKDLILSVSGPKPSTLENGTTTNPFDLSKESSSGSCSSWAFSSSSFLHKSDFQKYNLISNEGRNLMHFVQQGNIDTQEIGARKLARTNAQAAALAVRRLYKFQSVDATTLGWSSASVAILLKRLLELYQEHHTVSFHVSSFYPLRLVFTPFDQVEELRHGTMYQNKHKDDDSQELQSTNDYSALDVYGGVLRLHPASTPIQWLQHLRQVTDESLERVNQLRIETEQYKGLIQSRHNWKVVKGFSCGSRDYFRVLQHLCLLGQDDKSNTQEHNNSQQRMDHALIPEPVIITVESDTACHRHRPTVTDEGTIQVSKEMCLSNKHSILRSLYSLSTEARQRQADYQQQQQDCKAMAQEIQWQLGLPRAVYRTGVLTLHDFLLSLRRMRTILAMGDPNDTITLKQRLAGLSLGITGSGHFCHLADDGSVIIPHDWH